MPIVSLAGLSFSGLAMNLNYHQVNTHRPELQNNKPVHAQELLLLAEEVHY
jgi:hypothetical protein